MGIARVYDATTVNLCITCHLFEWGGPEAVKKVKAPANVSPAPVASTTRAACRLTLDMSIITF